MDSIDVDLTNDEPGRLVSEEAIWLEETEAAGVASAIRGTGPGPERGRDAPVLGKGGFGRVDEHSGAYSYAIKVFASPSRSDGPVPQLALVYNSTSSDAPSFVAAGWRLAIGRIERNGPQDELPDFRSDAATEDTFVLHLDGSSYTLVRLASSADDRPRFRAKIEGAWLDAEAVLSKTARDPVSGEFEIDHWIVRDSDGARYQFGAIGGAGVVNHPSGTTIRNKMWRLVRDENEYGIAAVYTYALSFDERFPNHVHPARLETVSWDVTPDHPDGHYRIELAYTRRGADPRLGFDRLPDSFAGRRDAISIIWDRLETITSFYQAEDGRFRRARQLVVQAGVPPGGGGDRIELQAVREMPFDGDGRIETHSTLPPHRFRYRDFGVGNRALLTEAIEPFGARYHVEYAFVADVSDPPNIGLRERMAVAAMTFAGDGEANTTRYRYAQGVFFEHLGEHRGFARVTAHEETTGLTIVTEYTQSGVHNGFARKRTDYLAYDAAEDDGVKIEETETEWVALDFGGGRYFPFPARTIKRTFNEAGDTPIVTAVNEVAEQRGPIGLAIDAFGNIGERLSRTYAGGATDGPPLRISRELKSFSNLVDGSLRRIGKPTTTRQLVSDQATRGELLADFRTVDYDARGREREASLQVQRDDAGVVYRKSTAYDEQSGRRLRETRFNAAEAQNLVTRTFFKDGPYAGLPATETNIAGKTNLFLAYDLRYGAPTRLKRHNGLVVQTTFDGLGRPVRQTAEPSRPADATPLADEDANVAHLYRVTPSERSIEVVNLGTGLRTVTHYDSRLRPTRVVESGFAGAEIETVTTYDPVTGNVASVSEPVFVGDTPRAFQRYTYDARGRVVVELRPEGAEISTTYGDFTEVQTERVFAVEADGASGELIGERVIGRVERDALGRTVAQSYGAPGTSEFYEVRTRYDALDRPVEITDREGRVLHAVDYGTRLDDKPVAIDDAASGRRELTYDAIGNLARLTADGATIGSVEARFEHDIEDRVTFETVRDEASGYARTIHRVYDDVAFGSGLVASDTVVEEDGTGDVTEKRRTFTYDAYANPAVVEHDLRLDWPSQAVRRSVKLRLQTDHDGTRGDRLNAVVYPRVNGVTGGEVRFRYDDVTGAVVEILFEERSIWRLGGEGLDARLNPQSCVWGNGLAQRLDYDDLGRLQRSTLRRDGAVLLAQELRWDTAGNVCAARLRQADADPAAPLFEAETRYGYDSIDQLVSIAVGGDRLDYRYRDDGARLAATCNGETTAYHYDPERPQHLLAVEGAITRTLRYDAAGRVVEDSVAGEPTRLLDWTTDGKLKAVRRRLEDGASSLAIRYGYGESGYCCAVFTAPQRRLTLTASAWFELVYVGDKGPPLLRSHILSGGQRVATVERRKDTTDRILFYHRDHLGSVRLVTDQDGKVVSSLRHGPFGEAEKRTGEAADLGFGGYKADGEEVEVPYYATPSRPYDPDLGRFLSPDIVTDAKNGAFGFNRYNFCGNNPASRIDPIGRNSKPLQPVFVSWESVNDYNRFGKRWREAYANWFKSKGLIAIPLKSKEDIHIEMLKHIIDYSNEFNMSGSRIYFDDHGYSFTQKRAEEIGLFSGIVGVQDVVSFSCGDTEQPGLRDEKIKAFKKGFEKEGGKSKTSVLHLAKEKVLISPETYIWGDSIVSEEMRHEGKVRQWGKVDIFADSPFEREKKRYTLYTARCCI